MRRDNSVGAGTTLDTAVDPAGDEAVAYVSPGGTTGEVACWQGPRADALGLWRG